MLLPVEKGTKTGQFCSEIVEGTRKMGFASSKARKGRKCLVYIRMMVTVLGASNSLLGCLELDPREET